MATDTRLFATRAAPTALDRLVGWISPRAGLQRFQARQLLTRAYAAALPGDSWRPKRAGASANAEHAASAATLRAKSRSMIENIEYISAGMNARVAHVVGTGIVPRWTGRDGARLAALWKAWTKVADADGVRDLYGIQAAAVRAMDADGEVLIRIRSRREADGLPVPMQLQLLEIDRLDTLRTTAAGPNTIVQGIEYDPLGRVVAYYLWNQHPGDIGLLRARGLQSTRVAAAEIIHLYAPGRPGQGRGFPRLSPVIPRARDLQLLEDAELQRKNLEGRLSVLASGDVAAMAESGQFSATGGGSLGELASGGITQIPAGMNITVVEPKAAPGFVDYCKYNIHLICAGAGFTYEQATGDMREVNFSSARVRMLDFRREIEQLQWLTIIPVLCDRICAEFAAYAALAGLLSARPDWAVEHSTPKWDYVNPQQDIEADLAEIAGGLSSFSEKLRRRGYDPEVVFDELAADIKGLQERGIWDSLVMLLKGKDTAGDRAATAARSRAEDSWPIVVHNHLPEPSVEIRNDVQVPAQPAPAVEVRNEVHVPAQPAPAVEVRNEVHVPAQPAPAVEVRNEVHVPAQPAPAVEVHMPAPEVRLNLPDRRTTSIVERDQNGRIVRTDQLERNA